MAIRKVGARVELDGEREYKQALQEINAGNATLRSEMQKLQAEYKGNADSSEYLIKMSENLEQQLLQQQDKVAKLREAVKASADQYGEADIRTQKWIQQLNLAEAAEFNLKNQLDAINVAMSGYTQALKEINTGSDTLRTEMQKLQAEYKGNADSAEYLTKKSENLERQLQQQHDKVAKLREAVREATNQYGEADTRTQEWIQQLNLAEAAEFNLKHDLDETTAAMNGQNETMLGLGDTVSSLTEKFGVQLPKGIKDSLNSMNSFSAGTVALMGAAAAAVAGVTEGIKALHENAVQIAAEADELLTKSLATNLSTTLLQQLEYAAPLIDVSVETITGSMAKLTTKMADAAGGNESLQTSFENLGVSIQESDGQLRSAVDVFFDVIDAMGEIGNNTERDAVANELFGRSYQELNPLVKQGTNTLREYMKAADEQYVLTEDQIKILGELDDAVKRNELRWESIKKQIAAEFAPASTAALETFGKFVENAGQALIDSGLIRGFSELIQLATWLMEPLSKLFEASDSSGEHLGILYSALHGVAQAAAVTADSINWLIGLLETLTIIKAKAGLERMGTAMGYGASSGNYSFTQMLNGTKDVLEAQKNGYRGNGGADMSGYGYDPTTGLYYDPKTGNYIYPSYNAGGSDFWRGGLTWVGESGPELVNLPKGTQIYNAQDSQDFGSIYINEIKIDAQNVKEFNDIIDIVKSARVRARMQ